MTEHKTQPTARPMADFLAGMDLPTLQALMDEFVQAMAPQRVD